jgi:cell division protein FtsB
MAAWGLLARNQDRPLLWPRSPAASTKRLSRWKRGQVLISWAVLTNMTAPTGDTGGGGASQSLLPALLALIGVIAGVGTKWLVDRRKASGSIKTSEAEQLWAEGKAIRVELAAQVQILRDDILKCDAEAEKQREQITALHAEIAELRAQNGLLRDEIALLKKRRPPRAK